MAKQLSEKKQPEPISPAEENFRKRERDLAHQQDVLEQDRRALAVERNALQAQREELEMSRRKHAVDRDHVRRLAEEIYRLTRTI